VGAASEGPWAPAVAALLMSVSTIVVALDAQLLRRLDLKRGAAYG
jgi:cation transport ATPase